MTQESALEYEIRADHLLRRSAWWIWCALTPFAALHGLLPDGTGGGRGVALLWIALLHGCWTALTCLMANWAMGHAVLRRLVSVSELACTERYHAIALGIGCYVSYSLLLILAIAHLLNGAGVVIYAVAVWWIARSGWTSAGAESRSTQSPMDARGRTLSLIACWAGVLWLSTYFMQALLPNSDWDSAMYHLPLARRFLSVGVWATDADFEQFNFAGAVHLFYSVFLLLGAKTAISPFNFGIAVAVVGSVYALAREFWGAKAAIWAAAIMAGTNLLWELGTTARIDTHLGLFTVLACHAFLLWRRNPRESGWLAVMGMMLGVAMGIKFTAVFVLFALGLAIGAVLRTRLLAAWKPLVVAACLIALPSCFWYVRNTWELHDPIYPLLRGPVYVTGDGHVEKLKPAVAELQRRFPASQEYQQKFNRKPIANLPEHLFNWWGMLRHPQLYARRPYYWLSPFLILFFVAPLVRRDRTLGWLYAIALIPYVLIAVQTELTRYILPILPLFAVGAGVVLSSFKPRWFTVFVAGALALNLAINSAAELRKSIPWRPLAWFWNAQDEIAWVANVGYNDSVEVPTLVRELNRRINANDGISKNDTILMVGAGTSDLLECHNLPDNSRNAQPFLARLVLADGDYGRMAATLAKSNIRYLLVDEGYFQWVTGKIPVKKRYGLAFAMYHLDNFTREHADLIWNESPTIKLYRLRDPAS